MDIQKVRFANLNVNFDADKIKQEVDSLKDKMFDVCVHRTHLADQWKIPVFTEEQINNTTVLGDDNFTPIYKKYPAWKGISLTILQNIEASTNGGSKWRNPNVNTPWHWREDINTPYIKSIVEYFNFKILHSIRVLTLPKGGIGLVHNDNTTGSYYNSGCFSVTLNVLSGGSPLVFLENDKIFEVWPKQSHIFRDDCYHAIPITTSERITIRINGRPNIDTIKRLIESDSAMYV